MPFYRFLVHGTDESVADNARGFFTTRHAFGGDEAGAEAKVLRRLAAEFTTGASASIWKSGPPRMVVEKSWRVGLHQLHSAPNRGSTFYDERE